jgi:ectoine hydroxylase-related dioxygenase (phytanoyl-CoA dioxygenase family)
MYTGILYLDLDKKQETATYIAPWSDEMSKQTKLTQIECEEGTLVIFPGHLLHYVNPNLLNKDRVVISFDLDCDEQD